MISERLKRINRIILSVGHGDGDTGAVFGQRTENAECREIVALIAQHLIKAGVSVWVVPDLSLERTIQLINSTGNRESDWAIEIHKDSSDAYNREMHRRMGVYAHPDAAGSFGIADRLKKEFIDMGANPHTSWSRIDTDSPRKSLAFIRRPKMLSHIIEAGFIQGEPEPEYYADVIAEAIFRVLFPFAK